MVALDYFQRLGHDNHRRLSKLYAWEEKKSKTSWGAQAVDYEKLAAAAIQAMKAAELNRFLVVCALVSDLCCPGYDPKPRIFAAATSILKAGTPGGGEETGIDKGTAQRTVSSLPKNL